MNEQAQEIEAEKNKNLVEKEFNLSQITFSPDQSKAFESIRTWYDGIDKSKVGPASELSLGGYAGTGKTTLIKCVIDQLVKGPVAVMSLTGKAVSVLQKKGIHAETIHSTIYRCEVVENKPTFILKPRLWYNLIIVDEVSMVSTELLNDLRSFGIPILWVGDHGQLEPVGDNPELMKSPQVRLEEIHRQAKGNPIIEFAHQLRLGKRPVLGQEIIETVLKNRVEIEDLLKADQIIVAYNRTRITLNNYIRAKTFGVGPAVPTVTDKVICLKNKRQDGIFNGLQGRIEKIDRRDDETFQAEILFDDGRRYRGLVLAKQFGMEKGLVETKIKEASHWDYAYAVTCHKSQGSEWPFVIVVEEFCKMWSMARWRYTAVTRASERLLYALS